MKVLVVGTGAGGGIGRYERVLEAVLRAGHDWCEPLFLYRRPHPDYLAGAGNAHLQGATGVPQFGCDVLRASVTFRPEVLVYTHVNLARLDRVVRLLLGARVPRVVCTHGIEVWQDLGRLRHDVLSGAACVVAPSQFTASALEAVEISPVVIPDTLEPDWFSRSPGPSVDDGGLRIVTVTRLDPTEAGKRVEWVIGAMPAILDVYASARLTLVGRGTAAATLGARAEQLGVAQSIDFRTDVGHDELRDVYARAAIFALPSQKEGFGLAHLEAMASGKPVVGGMAGATPELVADGTTGILVRDADECTAALVRLAKDPELRATMGAAGRERALAHFGFDKFSERVRRLLEGVAA